ncbi:MAG: DUF6525 family protein [Pseudomonadota bacterium]
MPANLGATSLRRKRRNTDPMREFDRLPAELRTWLAVADLPWSPRSARRAFDRALARTKDPVQAIRELDRIQTNQIARDAKRVWGTDHPCSATSL